MKRTNTRAGWHTVVRGRIYGFRGRLVRVAGKFPTTEGTAVNLRDPDTDKSIGNYPVGELGPEILHHEHNKE